MFKLKFTGKRRFCSSFYSACIVSQQHCWGLKQTDWIWSPLNFFQKEGSLTRGGNLSAVFTFPFYNCVLQAPAQGKHYCLKVRKKQPPCFLLMSTSRVSLTKLSAPAESTVACQHVVRFLKTTHPTAFHYLGRQARMLHTIEGQGTCLGCRHHCQMQLL